MNDTNIQVQQSMIIQLQERNNVGITREKETSTSRDEMLHKIAKNLVFLLYTLGTGGGTHTKFINIYTCIFYTRIFMIHT